MYSVRSMRFNETTRRREERGDYCGLMLQRRTVTCICPSRKCRVKACTTLFAIITRRRRLGRSCSGTSEFMTLYAELYKEREKRLFPFIHSAHRSELISRSNGDRFRISGALTFGEMWRTVFMAAIISIHSFLH